MQLSLGAAAVVDCLLQVLLDQIGTAAEAISTCNARKTVLLDDADAAAFDAVLNPSAAHSRFAHRARGYGRRAISNRRRSYSTSPNRS